MAIAVQIEFSGAGIDYYDQFQKLMGFTPGGVGAAGLLFHWVTKTADGFRVTDVWTDRQTFDAFAAAQIAPKSAEIGLPVEPTVEFFEVHNYLTAGPRAA